MNKWNIASIAIVIISLISAIYFYSIFPANIAAHWGAKGELNGYMSKFWGLFLFPIIILGVYLLFLAIPYLDPKKENIQKFKGHYDAFLFVILLFFLYLFALTIFWNLGYKFNMLQLMIPGFTFFIFYLGILVEKAKRNFFVGIRTPWTLSSDYVWDKTHKLGSRLYKISALITLIGLVLPDYAIWFLLVPLMASSLYLVVYSFLIFRKTKA